MDQDLMERTLRALDHLNTIYRPDRYLSMAAAVASFMLLLYIAWRAMAQHSADTALIVSFFGATGFLTLAMGQIAYFFREGFRLISQIVKAELDAGRQP